MAKAPDIVDFRGAVLSNFVWALRHHPKDMPNFFYALHCTPFFARRIKLCMGKGTKLSLFGILQIDSSVDVRRGMAGSGVCVP